MKKLVWIDSGLLVAVFDSGDYVVSSSPYQKESWFARKHDKDNTCLASHKFESKEKAIRWCEHDYSLSK